MCNLCKGKKEIVCPACDGDKLLTNCALCGGKGKIPCPKCAKKDVEKAVKNWDVRSVLKYLD